MEVVRSIKHPAVRAAREALGQVGKGPARAFLADGERLVLQALTAGAAVQAVFILEGTEARQSAVCKVVETAAELSVPVHVLARGVFFRLLGLGYETSIAALAVIERRLKDPSELPAGEVACVLVGERIQDPRNVGVLVRTADAWAVPLVVFSRDSADPFSRPAVRSTTGSIFRVPVGLVDEVSAYCRRLKEGGFLVVGSSAHAERPVWEVDLRRRCALVVGNESEGLSEAARRQCDLVVRVPMWGGASSLNVTVAAGVLLYERARQLAGPGSRA